MNFLFSFTFWGLLLILTGLLLILRNIFGWDISIFRVILALILISFGASLLTERTRKQEEQNIMFSERSIEANKDGEYNIIFSSGKVDLSNLKPGQKVKVNTIFSEGKIVINPDAPILIKGSSAFGSLSFPDKKSISFGDSQYQTKSFDQDKEYIKVESSVVFGDLTIIEK